LDELLHFIQYMEATGKLWTVYWICGLTVG